MAEPAPGYVGKVLELQKGSKWVLALGCVFACGTGGSPLIGFYYVVEFMGALFQLSGGLIRAEVLHIAITTLVACAIVRMSRAHPTNDRCCASPSQSLLSVQSWSRALRSTVASLGSPRRG